MTNVSVVTGGAQGIGRAIVEVLRQRGDEVWVCDKAPTPPEGIDSSRYLSFSVADHAAVRAAFEQIITTSGRIDVLVNNAGITADNLALRLSEEEWHQVLDVNLSGSFWCAQSVLRPMIAQKGGVIVMVSSLVASTGNAGQVNYAASKAGIEAMTKTLAREYGKKGIRVNAVAPGFISTTMTDKLSIMVKSEAISRTALHRAGTPEEVALVVDFLTSTASSYITGQIIHINGGMW